MRYLSVCSGIEAATIAWHGLGWTPIGFAEIEPFPSAVLKHHYPHVPNGGDITKFHQWKDGHFDLLVGGTPCQSFSVAGLRKGLADPRGNLALTYLAIADRYRPTWLLWENVPGVLSSSDGRDFGSLLGALAQLGYGFAYRVLDAQYFGVPQRRRRVFVVGHLGDWRRAAAVLFERESLRGDPPPSREAGEGVAPTIASRSAGGGGLGTDFDCDGGLQIAGTLQANYANKWGLDNQHVDAGCPNFVTHALRGEGFDASEDGTGRGTPLVFDTTQITSPGNYSSPKPGDPCRPLARGAHVPAIAFNTRQDPIHGDQVPPIQTKDNGHGVAVPSGVRRLTPRECERLQGFPDDYTLIPVKKVRRERLKSPRAGYAYREINGEVWQLAADGPRYKALGNSMAVPVMRWLGEQIQRVAAV